MKKWCVRIARSPISAVLLLALVVAPCNSGKYAHLGIEQLGVEPVQRSRVAADGPETCRTARWLRSSIIPRF
jgi:hypothetical protein